jgi:hypothetical protein
MLWIMKIVLTLILLIMSFGVSATTYRWVDDQGVVHYSDMPHEGATEIELGSAQGYESSPSSASRKTPAADTGDFQYDSVEIVSPYEEEVLFNIETRMSMQVAVVPALRPNHFLRLQIDGKDVTDKPVRSRSFQIDGVFRGTHSARLTVVDADGNTVQQSGVRTFQVRQNIAQPRKQPRS